MFKLLRHTSAQHCQSDLRLVMTIWLVGCRHPPYSFSLAAPCDLEAHHSHQICIRWRSEASCHCLAADTWHRLRKWCDMYLCATEVKCLNANRDSVEVWCVPSAAMCLLNYYSKFICIIHVNRVIYSWNAHILGIRSPWRLNFVR